jgi:hypothetical protein
MHDTPTEQETRSIPRITVGLALLLAACTSISDTSTTGVPTSTTAPPSGTTRTTVLPEVGINLGDPCDSPGRLGVTLENAPALCSESALDGTRLDEPRWRETAQAGNGLELDEKEAEAVATAKALAPSLVNEGDLAVLITIREYARAAAIASEADTPVEDAFFGLVEGFQAANDASTEEALEVTVAMLMGVVTLKGDHDAGGAYADEMLAWLLELTETPP